MSTFNGTIPAYVFDPTTGEVNSDLCTLATCPLEFAFVEYVPTLAGNAAYLAIFAALLAPQFFLGIKGKTWGYSVAILLGLILEIIGYAARIKMHFNPFLFSNFLMYLIPLTIAPAFLTAAIYLCLGRIVTIYSESASRIKPRTYTIIFICCDVFSLVLQALGGGLSSSNGPDAQALSHAGVNVMIAGLSFQVASMFVFIVLAAEYAWRLRQRPNERNPKFEDLRRSVIFKAFLWGLGLATITIFIRCIFRVAELSEGFGGSLYNDEVTFMVLEGPMIIIACLALTLLHPALSFRGGWAESTWSFRSNKKPTMSSDSSGVLSSDDDAVMSGTEDKSGFSLASKPQH